jgi:hypothetical protein
MMPYISAHIFDRAFIYMRESGLCCLSHFLSRKECYRMLVIVFFLWHPWLMRIMETLGPHLASVTLVTTCK